MTSTPSHNLPPGVSPNHPLGPLPGLIDQLRTYTRDSAEHGPSVDLGVRTITAGSASDTLVPIFFRTTWPPGAPTRHQLIWMKPSIPSEAFGSAVNDTFKVVEAGGVVAKTAALWANTNPFTEPSVDGVAARDAVRRAVGLADPPTLQQIIKMMGCSMNGIMQVVAVPAQDAAKCSICRRSRPITGDNLDDIRKMAFGPMIFCEDCVRKHGGREIERVWRQAEAEEKQDARDSLGNAEG